MEGPAMNLKIFVTLAAFLGSVGGFTYFIFFIDDRYASAQEVKAVLQPLVRSIGALNKEVGGIRKDAKTERTQNRIRWHRNEIKLYRLKAQRLDPKERGCGLWASECVAEQEKIDDLKKQLERN